MKQSRRVYKGKLILLIHLIIADHCRFTARASSGTEKHPIF